MLTKGTEANILLLSSVGELDSKSGKIIALGDISSFFSEVDSFLACLVKVGGRGTCRCTSPGAFQLVSTLSQVSRTKKRAV